MKIRSTLIPFIILDLEKGVRAHGRAPLQSDPKPFRRQPKSLSSFVAGYKASVTKQGNHFTKHSWFTRLDAELS